MVVYCFMTHAVKRQLGDLFYLGWPGKPALMRWCVSRDQRSERIRHAGKGWGGFRKENNRAKGSRRESRRPVRLERKSGEQCGGGLARWARD